MEKIAYIMRGVPGSGKSTVAKQLAGTDGVIHSTDSYFLVGGTHHFVPEMLSAYHKDNLLAFRISLKAGFPVVVCDNTNARKAHYLPYVEAAQATGYMVAIVSMPHPTAHVAVARNTHGVPLHTIQRMLREWED